MKKITLLALSLLSLSAYAQPYLSKEQALQIFKIGTYSNEFEDYQGKFNDKDFTYKNCTSFDGEKHCTVARIDFYKDINGDGRKEVLVIDEAETMFTYGNTGQAFILLTQENSGFRVITGDIAIPEFLKTRGKNGYPDIVFDGPGCEVNVGRYNGQDYEYLRTINRCE